MSHVYIPPSHPWSGDGPRKGLRPNSCEIKCFCQNNSQHVFTFLGKFGQTFLIRFRDSKHIDGMTGAQHIFENMEEVRLCGRFDYTYLAQEANAAKVFPPFVSEPRSISRDRWNQSWAIACLSTCGASVGFFFKRFSVGVLSAFLMGPPCLERCVRLSGLVFLLSGLVSHQLVSGLVSQLVSFCPLDCVRLFNLVLSRLSLRWSEFDSLSLCCLGSTVV